MATPASPITPVPTISLDQAKSALKEALALFSQPENIKKLEEAKVQAAGDIMKIITIVTPLGIGIASNIISKYGFEPNQPGVMQFFATVQQYATDIEIAQLTQQLRGLLLPTSFAVPQKV